MFDLIQIALVGSTPIVVEEGLRKSIPQKLYLIHTKDEQKYKFEKEAKKLKNKIEMQHTIPVTLIKVDPFDMDENIKAILQTIQKERKFDSNLTKRDISINVTGGTKLMVAAATTAGYLSGSQLYYVMLSSKHRGEGLVKELPMPIHPEDDNRGKTSKTTSIIIQKIKKLGKCTNSMLVEEVRKDPRLRKNQRIEYHIRKLAENNFITISVGWEGNKQNPFTGKRRIDYKKRTIKLTSLGEYFAEFPGLMGNLG